MPRACRVGGADRVDPQLLAKFAPEIRVSTHGVEASGERRRPSAILPRVDRGLYRRRQRRRAFIGWSTVVAVAAVVVVAIVFGGSETHTTTTVGNVFSAEMTSSQYEAIHKGQSEALVLNRLGTVGVQEDQIEESQLPGAFPARPADSVCSYWILSDAPGHLVRLCFSDPRGVLLQKSVAVAGQSAAPTTLA